jgi:hypothetical protein
MVGSQSISTFSLVRRSSFLIPLASLSVPCRCERQDRSSPRSAVDASASLPPDSQERTPLTLELSPGSKEIAQQSFPAKFPATPATFAFPGSFSHRLAIPVRLWYDPQVWSGKVFALIASG